MGNHHRQDRTAWRILLLRVLTMSLLARYLLALACAIGVTAIGVGIWLLVRALSMNTLHTFAVGYFQWGWIVAMILALPYGYCLGSVSKTFKPLIYSIAVYFVICCVLFWAKHLPQ